MRNRLIKVTTVGLTLLATGCAKELTTVSVRFAMTPGHERFAGNPSDPQRQLASFPANNELDPEVYDDQMLTYVDTPQVALWGGKYNGHNVTFVDSKLTPGDYTFAAWAVDPEQPAMQGWIEVNSTGNELVDMFRDWKHALEEQKQHLAYAYETEGSLKAADRDAYRSFRRQLRMIENLQRDIRMAIAHEGANAGKVRQRNHDFMQRSVVLLFPGGDNSFHPTTQPAFNEQDMEQIRGGEPVTKMLLVSGFHDLQWKKRIVEHVRGELMRAKAMCYEEAQRLERNKQMLQITDHLRKNDRAFLANEAQLQATLGHIDQINAQIAELRERRMALAFAGEIAAPSGTFQPLEEEQRDLQDERVLMHTELQRTSAMLQDTDDTSPMRMALERRKQWFQRQMEETDEQMAFVDEARGALATLKDNSQIIHRQGELRMLSTSIFGDHFPQRVREALRHEAVMTVRLEGAEELYTPKLEVAGTDTECEEEEEFTR